MESEVIRLLVFNALREKPGTQYEEVRSSVGEKAFSGGVQQLPGYRGDRDGRGNLTPQDGERLREILWALIVQGVLIPGIDASNASWPFLRVTEYGADVLREGRAIPHDPDGYLRELRERVPTLDLLVGMYVTESLQCFLRGTYIASAVMLGVGSEAAMLKLIDATTEAIEDERRRKQLQSGIFIAKKFDALKKILPLFRDRLGDALERDLDVMLDGCFTLIRNCRNEAGHPTGRQIGRDECFANLQLFKAYCKRVYDLVAWLKENRI